MPVGINIASMMSQKTAEIREGLEGVVASATRLSLVDGEAGRLILAGYPMEEIAPHARFEELVYLLWNGALPDPEQLRAITRRLVSRRRLPSATMTMLREAASSA